MNLSQTPFPYFTFAAFGYMLAAAIMPVEDTPDTYQVCLLSRIPNSDDWMIRGALAPITSETKQTHTPSSYFDTFIEAANTSLNALNNNNPVSFENALAALIANNLSLVDNQLVRI